MVANQKSCINKATPTSGFNFQTQENRSRGFNSDAQKINGRYINLGHGSLTNMRLLMF